MTNTNKTNFANEEFKNDATITWNSVGIDWFDFGAKTESASAKELLEKDDELCICERCGEYFSDADWTGIKCCPKCIDEMLGDFREQIHHKWSTFSKMLTGEELSENDEKIILSDEQKKELDKVIPEILNYFGTPKKVSVKEIALNALREANK